MWIERTKQCRNTCGIEVSEFFNTVRGRSLRSDVRGQIQTSDLRHQTSDLRLLLCCSYRLHHHCLYLFHCFLHSFRTSIKKNNIAFSELGKILYGLSPHAE